MAEEYKTLREVAIAIEGLRAAMQMHTKVFIGVVAVGVAVCGFFYTKLDSVEDGVSRIEERLVAISKTLDSINARVQTASLDTILPRKVSPDPNVFPGLRGIRIEDPKGAAAALITSGSVADETWIFSSDPAVLQSIERLRQ